MTQREPVTVRIVHSNCGPGSSLPHFDSMKAYILSAVPDAVIIADNDDGRCSKLIHPMELSDTGLMGHFFNRQF